jgi:lysyl-tRNA synthetase class 2
LRQVRLAKIEKIRRAGINPYPDRYERTHLLAEARSLPLGTENLRLAGRLVALRAMGKLTFAVIQDMSGKLQIALQKNILGPDRYKFFLKNLDIGDFLGVEGKLFQTRTGEITVEVRDYTFLGKALRPLPEKWHGLQDRELCYRQRYLDLIMNAETQKRFRLRTRVIKAIRDFLDENGFEEVETPVLQTKPSGALARPFVTYHNTLGIDCYLRIAPETYLKRLIVGGYDKIYEFARCFRNEGMDPSHLQDFTMLEYYCAYWNYEDNMTFTEALVKHVLQAIFGRLTIVHGGKTIDFSRTWPRKPLRDLILEDSGMDIDEYGSTGKLRAAIRTAGLEIEKIEDLGRGSLIDALYKKVSRPRLIDPIFIVRHPTDLSPLARGNDQNPNVVDRFQLVVNTWEIVNAYSELVDPVDQRARLEAQANLHAAGDEEAMVMDEDYLLCMEYGMPPISGWGMGIDRFVSLLSDQDNLRDVVFFPLMRPQERERGPGEPPRPAAAAMESRTVRHPGREGPQEGAREGRWQGPREEGGRGKGEEERKEKYKKEKGEEKEEKAVTLEDAPFGISRERAHELFDEWLKSENLRKHCLAAAAIMKALAKRFGSENMEAWELAGLLHDLDFDREKEPSRHALLTAEVLAKEGVHPIWVEAIKRHNAEGLGGMERERLIDYALSAAETITGLIVATTLVMPDKKLASVKPKSVVKRMKKKDFARKVDRGAIRQCEKIGLDVGEFAALGVEAMRGIADQLGL